MRARSTAWFYSFIGLISLGLVLSACSLAEDITPPPGYQNNTPVPALEQGSPSPEATATFTPAASSSSPIPATTSAAAASASPSTGITLKGKVTNASSGSLPTTPLTANLYLYDTGTTGIDKTLIAQVAPTGEYRFDDVPASLKVTYYVMVDYSGVTYVSDGITYDGTFTSKDLPITIYDSTDDLTQLSSSQVHMQFSFPAAGQVQARMLYVISNLGKKTVMVQTDGTHIPFIEIPSGATDVQYELAQGGSPLARAKNGFALLPGADKQYGLIATFNLPYTGNRVAMTQPFSLPISSETVLVPVGVRVNSKQLSDVGVQSVDGTDYHLYQGGGLASGGTLSFTVLGKPGASTFSLNQQTTILLILLGVGLILIGAGIFLLRRNQGRKPQPAQASEVSSGIADMSEDRDAVIDAIIALDDQYKGSCITKEVYNKRRDELKKKLKELI